MHHPQRAQWLLAEREQHVRMHRWLHVHDIDRQLRNLGVDPPEIPAGAFDDPEVVEPAVPERADLPPPPETAARPAPSHRGHVCDVCGRTFKSKAGLGSHARSHR